MWHRGVREVMRLTLTFVYKLHLILPTPERAGKSLSLGSFRSRPVARIQRQGLSKGGDPGGGVGRETELRVRVSSGFFF